MKRLLVLLLLPAVVVAQRKQGNPLDSLAPNMKILTHFNDYEGWKASNPVVATDGKLMAFQVAHTTDRAGVGYGIVLYRF